MGTHFEGTAEARRALNVYIKLMRAAESVTARVNRHLTDYGLTVSQFGALEALYHLGPMNQGELAEKILKSSGNMTLVVDNLAKRGLVERQRDIEDRRRITVQLTPEGEALIAKIFPSHVETVQEEIGALTPEEQVELEGLLRRLGLGVRETAV